MHDFTNTGNTIINFGTISDGVRQTQNLGVLKGSPWRTSAQTGKAEHVFAYDAAISYAGEQEKMASRVAHILTEDGFQVFFATDRQSEYIADDMVTRFYRIYRYESRYVAAFVTEEYLRKDITMHEAATAMLRQREEGRNCLIPIYFGKAVLPNLDPDIHYIRGDGLREVELADKIRLVLLAKNR